MVECKELHSTFPYMSVCAWMNYGLEREGLVSVWVGKYGIWGEGGLSKTQQAITLKSLSLIWTLAGIQWGRVHCSIFSNSASHYCVLSGGPSAPPALICKICKGQELHLCCVAKRYACWSISYNIMTGHSKWTCKVAAMLCYCFQTWSLEQARAYNISGAKLLALVEPNLQGEKTKLPLPLDIAQLLVDGVVVWLGWVDWVWCRIVAEILVLVGVLL